MIVRADARHLPLVDSCVDCVVTSPPYWGLRDYGDANQIGLERTPYAYVDNLVAVFREVHRILKSDGTVWLNLGDCYATGAGAVGDCQGGGEQGARWRGDVDRIRDEKRGYRAERLPNGHGKRTGRKALGPRGGHEGKHGNVGPMTQPNRMPIDGLKPKDLVMVPARVALALQADGWYLRSDIIWSKPNPMPESVQDRPTRAHEYLFLLAKSERYHYDAAAIFEPYAEQTLKDREADGGFYDGEGTKDYAAAGVQNPSDVKRRIAAGIQRKNEQSGDRRKAGFNDRWDNAERLDRESHHDRATAVGRNKRTVWSIPTKPYLGAHFATMPEALVEPCILAGCPLGGLVLDPFVGSGTVVAVAQRLGRRGVGCDLAYHTLSKARTQQRGIPFASGVNA